MLALLDGEPTPPVAERMAEDARGPLGGSPLELDRGPGDEVDAVARRFGTACYIDRAFPGVLPLPWSHCGEPFGALVANTNLGGDNCHRGAVLGALVGAASGVSAFPAQWIAGLHRHDVYREQIAAFVEASLSSAATSHEA